MASEISPDSTDFSVRRYSFEVSTPKAAISGVMISHSTPDEIAGSMLNEFGISALDFIFNVKKEKLTLVNVSGFLDKWYIKRLLKADLKICIHELYDIPLKNTGNRKVTRNGDDITIENVKHNLRYTFSPLTPDPEDEP